MKRSLITIFIFLIIISFTACGGGGGSTNNDGSPTISTPPKKIILSSPKSIFVGKASPLFAKLSLPERIRNFFIPSAYASSTDCKLYQLGNDGNITLVDFLNDSGNKINATVSNLRKVSPNYFTMDVCINEHCYQVVGENATGKLYDISGVDIRYAVFEINETGELLILKDQTLIKLNFTTMQQIPLSNPTFKPIDIPCFITIYENYLNGSYKQHFLIPQHDNTVVLRDPNDNKYYKFDIMGINPPVLFTVLPFSTESPYYQGSWIDLAYQIPIIAQNNSMYVFRSCPSGINLAIDGGSESSVITVARSKSLDIQHDYEVNETSRILIYKTGYILTSSALDGSLNYQWVSKDLNFLYDVNPDAVYYYKNNTIYCFSGDTFKKADPINDTSYTTIYTHPTSIIKSWLINGDILFTAYITATNIGTYRIPKGDTTATKIDDSDMQISDIVEFTIP